MKKDFISIYIHIPFCKKKCNYCVFYSTNYDEKLAENFIDSLKKEFELSKNILNRFRPYTLYIGGGTPSTLLSKHIEDIFKTISNYFKLNDFKEITFEANPGSINKEKINLLKEFGVNRISLGLQSTDDKESKFLGRLHRFEDFIKIYSLVISDFVVNVDLIYGLPNQDFNSFLKNLRKLVEIKPHHISLYALEIHRGTPMWKMFKTNDDIISDIYIRSVDFLEKNGYMQYEISNFARENYISLHNMNYWLRGNYIGFGPSAASCIDQKRWKNISNIYTYIKSLNNGKIKLDYSEELSNKDIMNERLMLALRTRNGIEKNSDIFNYFKKGIMKMIDMNVLEEYNGRIRIKREYQFVSNKVITEIMV